MKEIWKEMEYGKEPIRDVIGKGIYKDYNWYILNLGTHPTAYVEIPKEHKYYKKHYHEIEDIFVHGGLTYSDDFIITVQNNSWFLGWDYAHAGDYMGCLSEITFLYDYENKKYTTEEIYEDVCSVIDQLIEVK